MNNLREALEATVRLMKRAIAGEDIDLPTMIMECERAIQSADTWREPDETTPGDAPVWRWDALEIGKNKEAYSLWRLYTWRQASSPYIEAGILPPFPFDKVKIVLAKENQGPPPDDWEPDEPWENPFKNEHGN